MTPLYNFQFVPVDLDNAAMRHFVFRYWKDLKQHNLLRYRVPEIQNPDLDVVSSMLNNKKLWNYICWDNDNDTVIGEVMLSNYCGKAAQAHFSLHPSVFGRKRSVEIGRRGLDYIFQLKFDGEFAVNNVLGLLPVCNTLAIRWSKVVGFQEVGILKDAVVCHYADPVIQDVVVSQIHRDYFYLTS
jgi:RimJ/RimL family protein N-acetyltransferase